MAGTFKYTIMMAGLVLFGSAAGAPEGRTEIRTPVVGAYGPASQTRPMASLPREIRWPADGHITSESHGRAHEAWGDPPDANDSGGGIAGGELSACCVPGGECLEVANEAECTIAGGIHFPGATCDGEFCSPAACCDEQSCGITDAYNCIANGRQYAGPGITCFDDPCGAGQGACCFDDSGCQDLPPQICDGVGGQWLGAGTSCEAGSCDIGACCIPGACLHTTISECLFSLHGEFHQGVLCESAPCSDIPTCAESSLFAFEPAEPAFFAAALSDETAGVVRADRFDSVAGAIETVTFWGLDLALDSEELVECTEPGPPLFNVVFHAEDDSSYGEPGPVLCTHTVEATRTPTGVLYMGFELNQYELTLPEPCVLTRGWLSISGASGNSCRFYWMSSNDGDDRSWCSGCPQPGADEQPYDLSFCLGGQQGGVSGACCDLSIGTCEDDVDIAACAANGQVFTPSTTCNDVPSCAATEGVCCLPDGNCFVGLPSECQLAQPGGNWIGPTATCDDCPSLGACCVTFEKCLLESQSQCASTGGLWPGQGAICGECPQQPLCDADSFISQIPDGPIGFLAGSSETSSIFKRFDDFSNVTGPIESVRFWGFDLEPIPNSNNFLECVETDPTFLITFHEDANSVPGAEVCSVVAKASVETIPLPFLGALLNEYFIVLPEPCVLTNGWVSIQGMGDPTCWFLWQSSGANTGSGASYCQGCLVPLEGVDLSVCLNGTEGGVFGACCDDESGVCQDDIEISDCADPSMRFTPDATCDDLEVECGVILGACCSEEGGCAVLTELECAAQEGEWLGGSSICSSCPCVVTCEPGAVPEGEPVCFDGYVDDFNGGCLVEKPAFSPISPGQTICGTSGLFNGAATGDFDWYELTVEAPSVLTWSGEAQFNSQFGIADGSGGCPASIDDLVVLAGTAALPCVPVSVSAEVGPGTYWLIFGPLGSSDAAFCGAPYTAHLNVESAVQGDLNGDGQVGVPDLLLLLGQWGACPDGSPCPADLDDNGSVGVSDLLILLANWG